MKANGGRKKTPEKDERRQTQTGKVKSKKTMPKEDGRRKKRSRCLAEG